MACGTCSKRRKAFAHKIKKIKRSSSGKRSHYKQIQAVIDSMKTVNMSPDNIEEKPKKPKRRSKRAKWLAKKRKERRKAKRQEQQSVKL